VGLSASGRKVDVIVLREGKKVRISVELVAVPSVQ
jgi:hypothetical protein